MGPVGLPLVFLAAVLTPAGDLLVRLGCLLGVCLGSLFGLGFSLRLGLDFVEFASEVFRERDGSGIWQEVQELNDPTGAVGFFLGY